MNEYIFTVFALATIAIVAIAYKEPQVALNSLEALKNTAVLIVDKFRQNYTQENEMKSSETESGGTLRNDTIKELNSQIANDSSVTDSISP